MTNYIQNSSKTEEQNWRPQQAFMETNDCSGKTWHMDLH